MIRHVLGAFETEHFGRGGAGHAQLLDERLRLQPPQDLVMKHDLPTSSHARLRIKRIVKLPTIYRQLRQHLPQPPRIISDPN